PASHLSSAALHPELHSFPTRRSSDLLVVPDQAMDQDLLKGVLAHLLAAGEDHPGHPEEDDVVAGDQHGGGVEVVQLRAGHRIRQDRKSTRLNSSHVSISYAVFCLKTK